MSISNWDDIRIFLALARHSKLARAAATIGIDPTTMSRRISRLSSSIGATLFELDGGNFSLTERGCQLLGFAERAEAAIQDAQYVGPGAGAGGLLRIGCPESFAVWFLGPRLKDFHGQYPNVGIDIVSPSWYLDPIKREVDVSILPSRPESGPLTIKKLTTETLHIYASLEYLASHPPIRCKEDLVDHQLIGYVREMLPDVQLEYWSEIAPRATVYLRSSSITMQSKLAEDGAGLALLPYSVGVHSPMLVSVLDEVVVKQDYWLVVREDIRDHRIVSSFVSWITHQARADFESRNISDSG